MQIDLNPAVIGKTSKAAMNTTMTNKDGKITKHTKPDMNYDLQKQFTTPQERNNEGIIITLRLTPTLETCPHVLRSLAFLVTPQRQASGSNGELSGMGWGWLGQCSVSWEGPCLGLGQISLYRHATFLWGKFNATRSLTSHITLYYQAS